MIARHPTEPYEAYLTIYSPEGLFIKRVHLGRIPDHRRRFFDLSAVAKEFVSNGDHLTVVHRVPSRLLDQVSSVDEEIELPSDPDYSFFRSLVEYSIPQGGNGSVIYETPPRLNAGSSSNTLTFTNQIVLSKEMDSYLILINSSTDPSYAKIGKFFFGVHCLSGELAVSSDARVGPFGIHVLDMRRIIPERLVTQEEDPEDGISWFTMVGGSDNAALMVLGVNLSRSLNAVSVEHTHPPQAYLVPKDKSLQGQIKVLARSNWRSILTAGRSDRRN
ncbi:hypothetical protein FIM07_01355 [SAR202 cluster bacterium AD-802-F09_MRT_200m]|nr:hypothetical protein [SAR202 cluster bacterium AD-802-F09_MRT_200m]